MIEPLRKKSPRAPSMGLDEALDRALRAYDKDRLHPAPSDVMAQHLGYKGANNGSALSALASLRYFGLLERPSDGFLAVSKDVEAYKFAPEEAQKQALIQRFLKSPGLYQDLLEKFSAGLPSDANLRYDLIQRGFSPSTADVALTAFKRSVEFAGYFSRRLDEYEVSAAAPSLPEEYRPQTPRPSGPEPTKGSPPSPRMPSDTEDEAADRIPVRLPGGRRAWLVIPTPFFEADKARLKAQIDLVLTQDDESPNRS